MQTVFEQLQGPVGGIVAGGIGVGFGAGYAFAQRTVLAMALERIEAAETEIARWQQAYIEATKSD